MHKASIFNRLTLLFCLLFWEGKGNAIALPATQVPGPAESSTKNVASDRHIYIQEYRVDGGGHLLTPEQIEETVYPYLGPYRSADDVEQARTALEKAYSDQGFQTVTVTVPAQSFHGGIVYLKVTQGRIARLRVNGSRYYSLDQIKREAPSLAEGAVPNFRDISRDIVGLNQLPDRRVTPALSAGRVPGTYDVDLNVKDTLPLHGSVELNNRYSADTTRLRLNGSIDYDNLWQLGHSIGASFQVAPEDVSQVKVFSGYYLARIPDVSWFSFMIDGTSQDSSVNTLGGIGVVGTGNIIGAHAIFTLPALTNYYHSVSLAIQYKHFTQDENVAEQNAELSGAGLNPSTIQSSPITYVPVSAAYSGTWTGKDYETNLNASATAGLRPLGSTEQQFGNLRFGSSGDFIYFRADTSLRHDLPGGLEVFAKAQGQVADQPLVNSEQFSGGGLGTVRGYLESEELGDNAAFGSLELRSPSFGSLISGAVDDWRVYVFAEGGYLTINDPLIEQLDHFTLASIGAGMRMRVAGHYNGSFDLGMPLDDATETHAGDLVLTFRLWAEF